MGGEAEQQEPPEAFPLALVLAAMWRAQAHGGEGRFLKREVIEHLGLRRTATAKRRLRPAFETSREEGLIAQVSAHGAACWRLTEAGERRLAAMRRSGQVGELPDSPQRRRWRSAQRLAGERIEEIREDAIETLEEAERLLASAPGPGSVVIAELRGRLWWRLERLAVATYCLSEWAEPDDTRRDPNQSHRWRAVLGTQGHGERAAREE
jgi:hypothetical protein